MRERREPVLAGEPAAAAAACDVRPPGSRRAAPVWGALASAVLHLGALFALLYSPSLPAPTEAPPIPVKLVFAPPPKPPPAPKPPPVPQQPPPRGPLASDDFGAVKPSEKSPAKAAAARPAAAPNPADAPAPAASPPPPPLAPPEPVPAAVPLPPAKPRPPSKPAPAARPLPQPRPPAQRGAPAMRLASRPAKYPGPAATRDEYLHYVNMLILRHLDLLPKSLIGNRRGRTVIAITVLDNGALAGLRVAESSGYPDLDRRVAMMVAAAGRFPPLPQWFQGLAMPLQFEFAFHESLGH